MPASRLLGRNPAYVQQFIRAAAAPARRERPPPARPLFRGRRGPARRFAANRRRPRPSCLCRGWTSAAAGAGAFDGDERGEAHIAFDPAWLRRVARGAPDQLSIIRVSGDSMAPSLGDGDDILVDRGDGAARLRDGIYVLRIDGALVVKRVAVNPAARTLSIRSDNPAYPGWPDCDPPRSTLSAGWSGPAGVASGGRKVTKTRQHAEAGRRSRCSAEDGPSRRSYRRGSKAERTRRPGNLRSARLPPAPPPASRKRGPRRGLRLVEHAAHGFGKVRPARAVATARR